MRHLCRLTALALCLSVPLAWAHGNSHKAAEAPIVKEQKPWGIAAEPKAAVRTIEVRMLDAMRFSPAHIIVRQGEVVRLRVRNTGAMLHELVIGTTEELRAHADLMKKFPTMEHDEPYMAHVNAGQYRDIVWHFNQAGTFQFACLIPGHFEAGMVGTIVVQPSEKRP
jgi:uncharacterized cupredoxin-like copper-binding protein